LSEAAPGFPDEPAYGSPERARLATAIRVLIDATMTTSDASADDLADATVAVEAAVSALGVTGPRGPGYSPRSHLDYLPRSPVVGEASPIAPGTIDWHLERREDGGDGYRCIATGPLGAAYEGPPGCVHGGVIALVFDEVLGIVNNANSSPGMTGTLTVKYRKPTPLHTELRWEAWVERVEGRRIVSKATVHAGDLLCAECEGLFVQPRPGAFGLP
jgi:acyl-coenzyme A thioesterase PaaI-like protein